MSQSSSPSSATTLVVKLFLFGPPYLTGIDAESLPKRELDDWLLLVAPLKKFELVLAAPMGAGLLLEYGSAVDGGIRLLLYVVMPGLETEAGLGIETGYCCCDEWLGWYDELVDACDVSVVTLVFLLAVFELGRLMPP